MHTAYGEFTKQQPRPIPATPPYAPTGSKHEPVTPVTGPVPPLTLLLALNEAKPTQTTVIHQGAKQRIPKHHMTARDLPRVPHDSQSMPRTCWACDPEAPATPWPGAVWCLLFGLWRGRCSRCVVMGRGLVTGPSVVAVLFATRLPSLNGVWLCPPS